MQFRASILVLAGLVGAAIAQDLPTAPVSIDAPIPTPIPTAINVDAPPSPDAPVSQDALNPDGLSRPTRTITGGTIVGVATPVTSVSSVTTVYNYLGIPFAQVPTGTLRFQPPQTSVSFKSPYQANKYGPGCIQQTNVSSFADTPLDNFGPTSEDCLYLNVYAPTSASKTNLKPVMFYIYGGNLQLGSANIRFYNGSSFAGFQDVVVVTANYRLSIFGFSNSPEVPAGSQNSGFLDQRAALAWIQKNIASFGGDPNRVTIQGQSAGGYSVKQLLANPPSPLPYRAGVIESQGILFSGDSGENYQNVSRNFNCSRHQVSPLACLQKVDATKLITYVNSQGINFGFAPVGDNVTQSYDVRPNINSGKFANVPFFLGTNAGEGRVLANGAGFNKGGMLENATLAQAVAGVLGAFLTTSQQQAVVNTYTPYYKAQGNSTYIAISRVITDFVFDCQTGFFVNYTTTHNLPNAWRYYYNATFANVNFFPNASSYHGSEIPQVWGTYDLGNTVNPPTPTQEQLSKFMQTTWANFFKNPSAGPGWVKYTPAPNTVAEIGGPKNNTGIVLVSPVVPDLFCPVFADYFNTHGY